MMRRGGADRIRTGVRGFAGPCLTSRPPRRRSFHRIRRAAELDFAFSAVRVDATSRGGCQLASAKEFLREGRKHRQSLVMKM
jgi:hypothetical protein